MTIPLWRRFAIAALSLCVAAVLFHAQLAGALILRGDDALRSGDRVAGIRYYRRALALDARSTVAADRLAFYLAMRRTAADARAAIDVASDALIFHAADAALLADRGLAEQLLGRRLAAQADFTRAAEAGNDARYDHFAARIALARGHRDEARRLFERALSHDRAFDPARVALANLR